MSETKPRLQRVSLSTGETVELTVMNWRGYVALKNAVIEKLGGRLGELLAQFLASSPSGEMSFSAAAMGQYLAPLITALNSAIDENTEKLIEASLVARLNPSDEAFFKNLSPLDYLNLRDASASINDLEQLVEKEKNSFAAALAKAARFLQSSRGTPSSSGGQDSSRS